MRDDPFPSTGPGLLDRDVPAPDADPSVLARIPRADASGSDHYELIPDDELATRKPPPWLMECYLTEGGFSVLYGPPGVGKSFLAIDWSYGVARGIAWHGHATQAGPVIYVAGEGAYSLATRVAAYRRYHQLDGFSGVAFVTAPVQLLDPGDVSALCAALDGGVTDGLDIPLAPKMVVFDTMARAMAGGDENSAQDIGRVVAAVDAIRRRTGAHTLLVHHTGWNMTDRERGSSALRGAADSSFSLTTAEGALTLECVKQRDAALSPSVQLRLVPCEGSCVVEGETRTATERPLTKTDRTLLSALRTMTAATGPATASAWLKASAVADRSFYDALARLKALNAVTAEKRRYSLTLFGESLFT